MLYRNKLILCLCLAVVCYRVQAQAAPQSGAAAMPLLNDTGLAFSSDLERSNYLSGGVHLSTTFDDNVLNTTSDRISNFAYSLVGSISLDQSRTRLRWKLEYAGGALLNQRLATGVEPSHNLSFEGQYWLSPHVSLLVRDHFLRTAGFYSQVDQQFTGSSGGLLQRPNQFVLIPSLSTEIHNFASAQLDYQFGSNSKVGISGDFNLSRYDNNLPSNIPSDTNFVDSNDVGADAYYSHRLLPNNWLGVTYRYQKLTFPSLGNTVLVHGVFLTDTVSIAPHISIGLFLGSDHADSSGTYGMSLIGTAAAPSTVAATYSNWSLTAGGTFNWHGSRTSFMADGSRSVSDGGGLLGAVQLIGARAAVLRKLSQSWSSEFGLTYANSRPLDRSASPFSSLRDVSGILSMTRTMNHGLLLTLGYARDLQHQYQGQGFANINHNRAWASVSYNFQRPIGR
jgi:hypothetical protein